MPHDPRRLRVPAVTLLLALLATLLPLVLGQTATAAPPTPKTPKFGKAIEPYAAWEGNTICDPVDRPGIRKVVSLIRKTYGSDEVIGTSRNACYTSSEHNDGRAVDWMIDASNKADKAKADAFLKWLLATDSRGNKYAMARRLGVMYIIFNRRMWRGYEPRGWDKYSGTNPHIDHIHLSFTLDGSTGRSSFWTGDAFAGPCATPSLASSAPKVVTDPMRYVPVAPTRVASTSSGTGIQGGSCRLYSSTSYTSRRLDVPVVGVGSVPRHGVAAVALQVAMRRPNWDSSLKAGPAGGAIPSVKRISTAQNETSSSLMVLPVGADGKVSFFTDYGATDVAVSVVGYYVDPNAPLSVRRKIAVGGGDQYDSVRPERVSSGTTLGASGSLKLEIAGRAGTDTDSTAAEVAITIRGGNGRGDVFVYGAGADRPKLPAVSYNGRAQTVETVVPIGRGGAIRIENSGTNQRRIDVDLVGAFETRSLPGGGEYSARRNPKTVVDTSKNLGLRSIGAGKTKVFSVANAVRRNAESVILQVTAKRPAKDARLTFWRADAPFPNTTGLSVGRDGVVSGTLTAQITDRGRVRVRNAGGKGLDLKVTVIGSFR